MQRIVSLLDTGRHSLPNKSPTSVPSRRHPSIRPVTHQRICSPWIFGLCKKIAVILQILNCICPADASDQLATGIWSNGPMVHNGPVAQQCKGFVLPVMRW